MSQPQPSVPPHVQIIQMGTAYWVSRLVCTAASFGLADHLANGPRSAGELAPAAGTNPRALHRFMRTLASFGILTQDEEDKFALTPLGDALKSDAPGSARSTILAMSGPWTSTPVDCRRTHAPYSRNTASTAESQEQRHAPHL
jgi:Dimerisation domain